VWVFARRGQLFIANGIDEGSPLVQIAPAVFKPAEPDFNPERYRFDSIVEGHALRLFVSGMPMYRSEN